jgi:integrase/recombinase XerD
MDAHLVSSSLSRYEQTLLDSNPLAAQIVPLLSVFKNRIRSEASWRVYKQDMKHFIWWLATERIYDLTDITLDDMYAYHAHLRSFRSELTGNLYSHATINRMFTVARRLLGILAEKKLLANPCKDLDLDKMPVDDETAHTALDDDQAQRLLAAIDISTKMGKRNFALVSLLLRTALRRNEAKMLNIGDIHMERGHYVATIRYAKGSKPGRVKVPPDVWGVINEYLIACGRQNASPDAPLFVSFRRGDHPTEARIDVKAIETLVKDLGRAIGIPDKKPLTPHGLRATFITLAMEHGATLEQTQYAARHKDPRMTERYRKRKFNLDNNAVDKLSFLAKEE